MVRDPRFGDVRGKPVEDFSHNHAILYRSLQNEEGAGFHRIQRRKQGSSVCPAVKDIFGKLRNDLSTPGTDQNSKKALISGSPVAQVNTEGVHENGVLSHSNKCGDPMGINIPSFGPTVAQADIDKTSSVCEGEFDLHSRDIGERWGDRCSDDENQISSDDVELDDIIQFQDKPLAVVAQADSLEVLAVETGFFWLR